MADLLLFRCTCEDCAPYVCSFCLVAVLQATIKALEVELAVLQGAPRGSAPGPIWLQESAP